jgi:phosphoribosylformylglycinamidine cyclo-ligase
MYNPSKPYTGIVTNQSARTWTTKYVRVMPDGFVYRRFTMPVYETCHTDGIGTKGIFHWEKRTFRNAVIDAMAMNLNDLLMYRAKPFLIVNHIFVPKEDIPAIRDIITALADECCEREIAIAGGETSIHNNEDGLEISISMMGFAEERFPNLFREGDVLVGLASSGIHSNGFTQIRSLMESGLKFNDEWLTPTRIYELPDRPLDIKGIQHITGGAFTKLKSRLFNIDAVISRDHKLEPQNMFKDIYAVKSDDRMMYETFNCGIGMVLAIDKYRAKQIIDKIGGEVIGVLQSGTGKVIIESKFSATTVSF